MGTPNGAIFKAPVTTLSRRNLSIPGHVNPLMSHHLIVKAASRQSALSNIISFYSNTMHVIGASINYHNSFCGDLAFRINDLFQFCRVSALVDTQVVCLYIHLYR